MVGGFRGKFEGGAMNDFVNGGDGAGAGAQSMGCKAGRIEIKWCEVQEAIGIEK